MTLPGKLSKFSGVSSSNGVSSSKWYWLWAPTSSPNGRVEHSPTTGWELHAVARAVRRGRLGRAGETD